MSMPLWATELADEFWALAGGAVEPPRDLRIPIASALPVTIVMLPRLRINGVIAWLGDRGISCPIAVDDRAIRACLVARSGHGVIFVEGMDPPDELRFSIGHELAHFLRHYWQPRLELVGRLGPEITQVLDGERPPNQDERVHALLLGKHIGYFVHLMTRGRHDGSIDRAEREADMLAFELLAPSEGALSAVTECPVAERRQGIQGILMNVYGLPAEQAKRYASLLSPRDSPSSALLRHIHSGSVELSRDRREEVAKGSRCGKRL